MPDWRLKFGAFLVLGIWCLVFSDHRSDPKDSSNTAPPMAHTPGDTSPPEIVEWPRGRAAAIRCKCRCQSLRDAVRSRRPVRSNFLVARCRAVLVRLCPDRVVVPVPCPGRAVDPGLAPAAGPDPAPSPN